jgi:hypothetical protein
MFDAEKLLSNLLQGALGNQTPKTSSLAAGLGLLGISMAAYEHFTKPRSSTQPLGHTPDPMRPTIGTSPLPGLGERDKGPPPPPVLGETDNQGPPPPPPPAEHPVDMESEAILLIRAMIAAANADGHIDGHEMQRIGARLRASGMGDEAQDFIERELNTPRSPEDLAAEAHTSELAERLYAVSLAAIDLDNEAEHRYLNQLAGLLRLDPAQVARIHRQLGR